MPDCRQGVAAHLCGIENVIRVGDAAALLLRLLLLVRVRSFGFSILVQEFPKHHGRAALTFAHLRAQLCHRRYVAHWEGT